MNEIETGLTYTEENVYLELSLEFHKIIEEAPNFQMGAYRWHQILPERLQKFALTTDTWERISNIGDKDEDLQIKLNKMIDEFDREREF